MNGGGFSEGLAGKFIVQGNQFKNLEVIDGQEDAGGNSGNDRPNFVGSTFQVGQYSNNNSDKTWVRKMWQSQSKKRGKGKM